jgi:hypothetical protein
MVIALQVPPRQLFAKTELTVTKLLRNLKRSMIALAVLMENTATKDSFKVIAMQDTSVISELLPGKMKTRSAKRVTTVLQAVYFQLDVLRLCTGLVPVLETSHTAHLVKLDTTALIMIVFPVYVPKVTSVPRRPRSQFHAGRVSITHTRDRRRIQIV